MAEATGLSQSVARLDLTAPPGLGSTSPLDGADAAADQHAGPTEAPDLAALRGTLFHEWVEQEILSHFELVQARVLCDPAVGDLHVVLPTDVVALEQICHKLAYVIGSTDPWLRLGLARFEGPAPSEQLIAARLRTALVLCDLTLVSPLDDAERSRVTAIADELRQPKRIIRR